MAYYKIEAECLAVAQKKEALLTGSFMSMGHIINISGARCGTKATAV